MSEMSKRKTASVPSFLFQKPSPFPQFQAVRNYAFLYSCHRVPQHSHSPLHPFHTRNHIIHCHICYAFLRNQRQPEHAATEMALKHIFTGLLLVLASPPSASPPGNTTVDLKFVRFSCTTNNIHRQRCSPYFICLAIDTLRNHNKCLLKSH